MPNHKSAWKRMRQSEKRRVNNRSDRSFLRSAIKSFRAQTDLAAARESFPQTASIIDRAAKKGIIHYRNAARLKSRLSKKIAGS
jgi:small subunit ribosomal protein S20